MKYKRGYTTGVFDLFHIGHLNILRRAKERCEYLIVGVTVDELALYKGKAPVIPFKERIEIVRAIRYVDEAIPQTDLDKTAAHPAYHFDALFVGDDWKGSSQWNEYEKKLKKLGADVVYLPYTQNTSSTLLAETLNKIKGDANG